MGHPGERGVGGVTILGFYFLSFKKGGDTIKWYFMEKFLMAWENTQHKSIFKTMTKYFKDYKQNAQCVCVYKTSYIISGKSDFEFFLLGVF